MVVRRKSAIKKFKYNNNNTISNKISLKTYKQRHSRSACIKPNQRRCFYYGNDCGPRLSIGYIRYLRLASAICRVVIVENKRKKRLISLRLRRTELVSIFRWHTDVADWWHKDLSMCIWIYVCICMCVRCNVCMYPCMHEIDMLVCASLVTHTLQKSSKNVYIHIYIYNRSKHIYTHTYTCGIGPPLYNNNS